MSMEWFTNTMPTNLTECEDLYEDLCDNMNFINDQIKLADKKISLGYAVDMHWYHKVLTARHWETKKIVAVKRKIRDLKKSDNR